MLKPLRVENDAPWKQRYRAATIAAAQVARSNPTRGMVSSTETGQYQLYAWSVPAGRLRQLTFSPEGANGSKFWASTSLRATTYGGEPAIIAATSDITERKNEQARRARDLDALSRMHILTTRTLETEDFEDALGGIMETAVALMQADKGTLQLLEGQTLRIVAHHGHEPPFLRFFAKAENVASVCGSATRRGERVIVEDVEESPLFTGTESLEILRNTRIRAIQSTPLISHDGQLSSDFRRILGTPPCTNVDRKA